MRHARHRCHGVEMPVFEWSKLILKINERINYGRKKNSDSLEGL
ncbi:hypothetical protein AC229_0437 [Oenococcus oeni]|nr:hypothetical protein AC229_0437 [Oenococcus oeni]